MRVHMTSGHTVEHRSGVTTTYHGGRSYVVSDELGAELRELGKCLLATANNEPIADPEPDPEPEPEPIEAPSTASPTAEQQAAEPLPEPPSFDSSADDGDGEDDEPTEED